MFVPLLQLIFLVKKKCVFWWYIRLKSGFTVKNFCTTLRLLTSRAQVFSRARSASGRLILCVGLQQKLARGWELGPTISFPSDCQKKKEPVREKWITKQNLLGVLCFNFYEIFSGVFHNVFVLGECLAPSPGPFSLAFSKAREKRPGDEVASRQLGNTRGIHFSCRWNAVKAPPCGEKIQSKLPSLIMYDKQFSLDCIQSIDHKTQLQ